MKVTLRCGMCWTPQTSFAIRLLIAFRLIAEKMKQLKERYFAFLTEEQAAGLFGQPDDYIAMSACSTCAGFIATLEDRVRAGKPAVAAGAS